MKCKEYGQNALLLVAMMKEMCCKCEKAVVHRLYSCPNIDSEVQKLHRSAKGKNMELTQEMLEMMWTGVYIAGNLAVTFLWCLVAGIINKGAGG